MERKELDEKILAAITTLNSEGKSLTVINIEQITGLLKYQIYSSKYKSQLEIRGRRSRRIQPELTPEVVLEKATTTDIDLGYKHFGTNLTINLKDATAEDIQDAIEDLEFMSRKSIERLQREKAKLH